MTKSRPRSIQTHKLRKRGGPARRVGDMLPEIGQAGFKRFGFIQSAVISRWPEIVGERYARVSAPESIRFPHGARADGVLHMVCASAHAPMIQHVTPEIIDRVNRFFGYSAVSRVAIRHGEIRSQRAKRAVQPVNAALSEELGDSLKQIADLELKTVLEALAQGIAASEARPVKVIGKIS